jgi:hypothetical protein
MQGKDNRIVKGYNGIKHNIDNKAFRQAASIQAQCGSNTQRSLDNIANLYSGKHSSNFIGFHIQAQVHGRDYGVANLVTVG